MAKLLMKVSMICLNSFYSEIRLRNVSLREFIDLFDLMEG